MYACFNEAKQVDSPKSVKEGCKLTNTVEVNPTLKKKSDKSHTTINSWAHANLHKSERKSNISKRSSRRKGSIIKMLVAEAKDVESDISEKNAESEHEENKAETDSDLKGHIVKKNRDAENPKVPSVDKAKQPTATLVTPSRIVGRRKGGKPRAKSQTLKNCRIECPAAYLSTARRGPWQRNIAKNDKKLMQEQSSTEKKSVRQQRRAHLDKLDEQNAELRRRLKNVKSKLFSDTRSFASYKYARSREMRKLKDRNGEMARRTEILYADRAIDFNKKSWRQSHGVSMRRKSVLNKR